MLEVVLCKAAMLRFNTGDGERDSSQTELHLEEVLSATCSDKSPSFSPEHLTMQIGNKLFCPRTEHLPQQKRSRKASSPIRHQRHAAAATSYLASPLTGLLLIAPAPRTLGNGPQMQMITIRSWTALPSERLAFPWRDLQV